MYPHVKGQTELVVEGLATLVTFVPHVPVVSPQTVVLPAPEPVALTTHGAGVQLRP